MSENQGASTSPVGEVGSEDDAANEPVATIVIPLYNKESTVGRAVQSVRDQSSRRWMLLVIDDGSTDGSASVVEQFDDPRIKLIHQENGGPAVARNAGLALVRTEFVAFLDADDELRPRFLESAVPFLCENRETIAVATGFEICDVGRTTVRVREEATPRVAAPSSSARLKQLVDAFHSSAVLARADEVRALGGFYDRTRCTYGEDSYLWFQVIMRGGAGVLDEVLAVYHRSDGHLGAGRATSYPIPPLIHDRHRVVDSVPEAERQHTDRYLDWYTAWFALRVHAQGDPITALKTAATYRRASPTSVIASLLVVLLCLASPVLVPLGRLRRRLRTG